MKFILVLMSLALSLNALAQDLTINGAEFGIGKFHRKDNKEHVYEAGNAWKPYILPEGVSANEAYIQKNSETDYTIFFTNLQELLEKIVEITNKTGKRVGVFNLNAHGLPGGTWFPKDAKTRDSMECSSWRSAASDSDEDNYDQYYSTTTKEDMLSFNSMSNGPRIPPFQCLTGINEWVAIVAKVPAIKKVFTHDAQIHLLSCLVGLGTLGDAYTQGLAKLLFETPDSQQVQTSIKLGLGDWSMPEGMGFWGFESDAQLDRDNEVYPVNKRDSEIMQKGSIRVAQVVGTKVVSGLINGEDFIYLTHDVRVVDYSTSTRPSGAKSMNILLPASIRIPGTGQVIKLK